MAMILVALIVLLFAALPTWPYTASDRAVRPPLDRGLVVVGDEPYPHPVFGRPSDRRASAAVL